MVEAVLEPLLQIEALEALYAEGRFYASKVDNKIPLTLSERRRWDDVMNQLEVKL